MKGYLGETILDIHKTEFAMYSRQDWVMLWIELYGTISGVQHKEWLIDQIVMILKGSKVVVKVAKWDNGQEEKDFLLPAKR